MYFSPSSVLGLFQRSQGKVVVAGGIPSHPPLSDSPEKWEMHVVVYQE